MYADLVIISFIYIGNEIRATIQFLLCEAFLKFSSTLLNLTEPMALIPENATIENKVEFQNLCQVFLAHLSHRLRVSYCHWPMYVVRRALCVVNNCFKEHLL